MKGRLTLKVLEFLEASAASTEALLDAFLTDYHTSYRKLRGISEFPKRKKRDYDPKIEAIKAKRAEMQSFYDLMTRLKQDGLIEKSKPRSWKITKRGLAKKLALATRIKNSFPIADYRVQDSNEWKIVIFDIPEKERRKRIWLRAALKRLDFRMLQKSVWIGKKLLPEKFIRHLVKLHLIPYIEILVITKSGSLRQL